MTSGVGVGEFEIPPIPTMTCDQDVTQLAETLFCAMPLAEKF